VGKAANGGVANGGHLMAGKNTLRIVGWFSRKLSLCK